MPSVFEKDLEFVQLLCNPEYLRWLNNEKYFLRDDFKAYLKYLLYFSDQKYYKFLTYPQCIFILEILNKENVLDILSTDSLYIKLAEQQHSMWKYRV